MRLLCNAYFSNIGNNKNVFLIKCSSDLISFVWLDTVRSAASNFGATFAYVFYGVCGITFCEVVFNELVLEPGMIILDFYKILNTNYAFKQNNPIF